MNALGYFVAQAVSLHRQASGLLVRPATRRPCKLAPRNPEIATGVQR